jgi:hypothetical protein
LGAPGIRKSSIERVTAGRLDHGMCDRLHLATMPSWVLPLRVIGLIHVRCGFGRRKFAQDVTPSCLPSTFLTDKVALSACDSVF